VADTFHELLLLVMIDYLFSHGLTPHLEYLTKNFSSDIVPGSVADPDPYYFPDLDPG
jgi:hypothetical protein